MLSFLLSIHAEQPHTITFTIVPGLLPCEVTHTISPAKQIVLTIPCMVASSSITHWWEEHMQACRWLFCCCSELIFLTDNWFLMVAANIMKSYTILKKATLIISEPEE